MKPNAPILLLSTVLAAGVCTLWLLPISNHTTRIKITRTSPDTSSVKQPATQGDSDPYFDRVNFVAVYSPS